VQAQATRAGVPLEDALHFEKVVQRNAHALKIYWNGMPQDFGHGLFPRSSGFNHSCHPNASWNSVKGGLVTFLTRGVDAGEEVTVTYVGLAIFGKARRDHLE
jgi:hypothetical protein